MQFKTSLLIIVFMFSFVPGAFAYLDPGSGSFIIQMIIASVAGVAYALKVYWNRVVSFFKGTPVTVDPDEELNND